MLKICRGEYLTRLPTLDSLKCLFFGRFLHLMCFVFVTNYMVYFRQIKLES